jgi:hypothetical protein
VGVAPAAGGRARGGDGDDLSAPARPERVHDAAPVALRQVAVMKANKFARVIRSDGVDLKLGIVAVAQGGRDLFE